MIEIEAKLKRWGRSFGIIVPMEKVREAGLREEENLKVRIMKEENPFLKNFGILKGKLKKSTEQLLKESDEEGWDE